MKIAFSRALARAQGKYQRTTARYLSRRLFSIRPRTPIISFTFDDFPRSALWTGGRILKSFGLVGTYYASLGLIGKEIETGTMLVAADLAALLQQGHELGCHTFDHCHAWNTQPQRFEDSINENRVALEGLAATASFKSLSYPIGVPRAQTKRIASKYFACCRGGGQTFNIGTVDLNYLSALFLEQSRDDPRAIKRVIDENSKARGWLIFATHDISDIPTQWGCLPRMFEDIVEYSVNSGARILPVFRAYESIVADSAGENQPG